MPDKIEVAVVGATGYTGQELLKLLFRRDDLEVLCVTSESSAGLPLAQAAPSLQRQKPMTLEKADPEAIASKAQVAFLCLPHGKAMDMAGALLDKGLKVFDLSADFRLKNPALYNEWYGMEHSAKHLLERAVYGLPELFREKITQTDLVAVPGCYPTSVILAMAPLVKFPGLETDVITVNASSGVSGAGRTAKESLMYAELDGDYYAYGAPTHRHTAEMEQQLGDCAGRPLRVAFIPHLLPATRGIYSTITVRTAEGVTEEDLHKELAGFYENERFVTVVKGFPQMKWAAGTNAAFIGVKVDKRARMAIIASAIDNLIKGASGQAVQCFNIAHGIDETKGLE